MAVPGVFGARMMGGGFGGCCIALVSPEARHAAAPAWAAAFRARTARAPTLEAIDAPVFVATPGVGATIDDMPALEVAKLWVMSGVELPLDARRGRLITQATGSETAE